jgi:hypothetical protein
MSITWTPVPIPTGAVELFTEAEFVLLTEDGIPIVITHGLIWTEDTISAVSWTPVPTP